LRLETWDFGLWTLDLGLESVTIKSKPNNQKKTMSEENEDKPTFKVTDRRLFNADGTPRDIIHDEESPKTEKPIEEPKPSESVSMNATETESAFTSPEQTAVEEEEEELPDANDPASFMNFLMDIVVPNAAISLGMMEHPSTGQRGVNLQFAKHWIDVLMMLKEKTKGNLHPAEQRAFDGLLAELQMQYVAITRAAAEQAKKQPPKGFSAQDILGRK